MILVEKFFFDVIVNPVEFIFCYILFIKGNNMKNLVAVTMFSVFLMGAVSNASAFWGNDKDWECYGPYGKIPGCNPYDEWDPRYWMEEMEDMFEDDDDYYGGGYGRMPYGGGYGMPQMPYGGGYGMPQMPYGGGYGAPQMPYGGGYGMPQQGGYPQYNPYAAPAAPVAPAPAQ